MTLGSRLLNALRSEGSGRLLGLMRITVALMVWARFADRFQFHPTMEPLRALVSVAFYASSFLMCLGQWTRSATPVLALVLLYGYHGLGWTSHNMMLLDLTVAVLAFTPCGQCYSLDRHWALARAERTGRPPPSEVVPLWSTSLLAILLSSVYLSTFVDKCNEAFLSGRRLQVILAGHYTGSDYLDTAIWTASTQGLSIAVWFVEGALIIGLLWGRLRVGLMCAGAFMHLCFYALFRIYAFSTNMILLYFAFVPPRRVEQVIDELCAEGNEGPARAKLTSPLVRRLRLLTIATVTLAVVALGVAQVFERDERLDARLPVIALLQPAFDPEINASKRRPADHKEREMQRWSP